MRIFVQSAIGKTIGCGADRHDREREADGPGQGERPVQDAAPHIRGRTAEGRAYASGIQYDYNI